MAFNLNKMQKLVYKVIQEHPGVQNDDAELVAAVWRECGWNDNVSLEDNIRRMPRGESLTRRRRELHNMELITYTDSALETRTEAYNAEVERHGKAVSWLDD